MTPPKPLTDPLSLEWLAWCEAEHIPATTIARRRSVLRNIGNAGTATRDEIDAWWETRRDMSPSSRSNERSTLRSLYAWCQLYEKRTDDPSSRLRKVKVNTRPPRDISREEFRHLLAVLEGDMRRAVALGGYTGMRVAEAANLDWSNVRRDNRRIEVCGKGGKWRLVPLGAPLLDAILPETGGNVVAAGGKPYTAQVLQRKVNRAMHAAGVPFTFHSLRHRWGTIAYAETRDLLAVGRALGHASPVTTAIYAATSDDALDIMAEAVAR